MYDNSSLPQVGYKSSFTNCSMGFRSGLSYTGNYSGVGASPTPYRSLYNNMSCFGRGSPADIGDVVRSGQVLVTEGGGFTWWIWKVRWLVLKDTTLSMHKSEGASQKTVILLRDILSIERTDRTPHCLLLETKDKRYYFSLKGDEDLYGWQNDIYQRSPVMRVSNPTNFVHNVHVGFDPFSGAFTGLPDQWSKLLAESAITQEDYARNGQVVLNVHNNKRGITEIPNRSFSNNSSYPSRGSPGGAGHAVRSGQVLVKEDGVFASWTWKLKWLVLRDTILSMHKSEGAAQQAVVLLRDIVSIERTNLKSHCLLLETKHKRYYLSLKGDEELYGWQDDIYQHSSLMGVSNPTDFVHNIHVGFDPVSGELTGLPYQWSELLTQSGEDCAKEPQAVLDAHHKKREMEEITGVMKGPSAMIQRNSTLSMASSSLTLVGSTDSEPSTPGRGAGETNSNTPARFDAGIYRTPMSYLKEE